MNALFTDGDGKKVQQQYMDSTRCINKMLRLEWNEIHSTVLYRALCIDQYDWSNMPRTECIKRYAKNNMNIKIHLKHRRQCIEYYVKNAMHKIHKIGK